MLSVHPVHADIICNTNWCFLSLLWDAAFLMFPYAVTHETLGSPFFFPALWNVKLALMAPHCNYCVTFWLRDDNTPYQCAQGQRAWLRKCDAKPPTASCRTSRVPSVWHRYRYNKAIKSGSGRQYKPLPITLTQCWYILIIFGGERAYRLSCTGQMETNHNNIEQGAVWPT